MLKVTFFSRDGWGQTYNSLVLLTCLNESDPGRSDVDRVRQGRLGHAVRTRAYWVDLAAIWYYAAREPWQVKPGLGSW